MELFLLFIFHGPEIQIFSGFWTNESQVPILLILIILCTFSPSLWLVTDVFIRIPSRPLELDPSVIVFHRWGTSYEVWRVRLDCITLRSFGTFLCNVMSRLH